MSDWEEALRPTKQFSIEGVSGHVNTYDTYAEKQRVQAGKTRLVQKSNRNFLHNLIYFLNSDSAGRAVRRHGNVDEEGGVIGAGVDE